MHVAERVKKWNQPNWWNNKIKKWQVLLKAARWHSCGWAWTPFASELAKNLASLLLVLISKFRRKAASSFVDMFGMIIWRLHGLPLLNLLIVLPSYLLICIIFLKFWNDIILLTNKAEFSYQVGKNFMFIDSSLEAWNNFKMYHNKESTEPVWQTQLVPN